MADFDYYKSPGTQFDFSPLSEAGRTYARAGEDVGASIREAAKMLMMEREAKKDRDMRERMGAADRANALFRDFLGEQGANSRNAATIGASNARAEEARQAQMRGQDMTLEAAMERERGRAARADANEKAKAQAEEQKKANATGAFKLMDAMRADPKASPVQVMKLRGVDTDAALGSIYAQGGERGLIAHFKSKGKEEAEATQAAKAALKPMEQPFLDSGRLGRFTSIASEQCGPDAAKFAAEQLQSEHGTFDQVMERLRGGNAQSMSDAFGGAKGKDDKPKLVFPDGDSVDDKWGLAGGGDFESMTKEQRAALFAMGSAAAQKDKRWPTVENAVTQAMMSGVPPEQLKQIVAEIPQQQMLLSVEHGNQIAMLNGWKASAPVETAPAQGLQNASGEQILQQEIADNKITTDEQLEKRAKELGVKLK